MKAFIRTRSEKAAGIRQHVITVAEIPDVEDRVARNKAREILLDCFSTLLDEPVSVQFDDECPDCGSPMKFSDKEPLVTYICSNPKCVNSRPEET